MTNEHDEEKFLAPLRENPQDLNTWGVYADWLEEHGGRPATAEMIRRHVKSNQERISNGDKTVDAFHFRDIPRTSIRSATGNPTYIKAYPDANHDLVSTLIPSGQEHHIIHISSWMPRKVSKRLIPNLAKEGIPLHEPDEHHTEDKRMQERWKADNITQPEAHHMSRRRDVFKYAISTVARVMGHGQYANETSPAMVGSRLATVLREIKHGVGKDSPLLQKLTTHALGGSQKGEVYTGIRDELFRLKDPRAVQLARQYNWHKVGEGLERDKHLRDFVSSSAKGTQHENHHQMFRKFYNGIVHGIDGPQDHRRGLFYKAMRQHLQTQTGKSHSDEEIQDSLRRLGETEENHSKIKSTNPKGNSKFELPDYEHPAYTGTPKEGKFPPKKQITPIEKRAPGQYRRSILRKK